MLGTPAALQEFRPSLSGWYSTSHKPKFTILIIDYYISRAKRESNEKWRKNLANKTGYFLALYVLESLPNLLLTSNFHWHLKISSPILKMEETSELALQLYHLPHDLLWRISFGPYPQQNLEVGLQQERRRTICYECSTEG